MANQRRNTPSNPSGLRSLPKPVRPNIRQTPRPLPPPIDPDDFELPQNRPVRRPAPAPMPSQPTWPEVFRIFFRRMAKKYAPRRVPGRNMKKRPKTRNPYVARIAGFSILGVVCIALIVSTIWLFTNKNAYAVYLGPTLIGHAARVGELDGAELQAEAVSRLEASLDARVQVNENVTVQLVHTGSKNISPDSEILDKISRGFTYKIAATAFYVQGREIAVLRNQAEAQAVADYLWAPYLLDGVNYISKDFVEEWDMVTKLVDQEELNTKDDALLQLDKKERTMVDYVIQKNDMLGTIARKNNTTVEKICADNPGYTAATVLRVGNIIKLESTKPHMSVKTVEEVVRREAIPMTVKTVDNALEPKSYTKVIQEGQDGEQEVTVHITRINGIQTGAEQIISTNILRSPVDRVVEVGISEAATQRR